MNRLWVRLSLIFSSLILVFSLLPLAAFIIFLFTHEPPTTTAVTTAAAVPSVVSPLAAPICDTGPRQPDARYQRRRQHAGGGACQRALAQQPAAPLTAA